MRHHPAHLRSVILDSVLPASVRAIEAYPANFERVFELLFSTCKADARCNTTYPNLETIFYETADRLNRKPILVENVSNPLTGATFDVWVDGNAFIGLIYQQFYLTHAIPQLPQRIFAANNGQKRVLYDALVSYVTAPALSYEAMGLSVECADIVPHNDQARFDLAVASLEAARLRTYFETIRLDAIPRFIELCALWHPTDEDQTANLPVSSDIPTLIFAGQFDPVTPPEWGQQVAQSLPNGFYVEVPAHGHGVTNFSICPVNIAEAFLSDPHVRPNAGCAERQVLRFRY
jgi:pimeloyl-ACP methyl ester carboxylesterase